MTNKRAIGSHYEAKAAEFLKKQGYEILDCNYQDRYGEIDLVAKDGDYLVLGLFIWNYTEEEDGERIYTHANFASRYAVNRITKEIIEERDEDENGDMIYDSRYDKFFSENALVYKDYYE